MQELIQIKNLSFKYEKANILSEVTFSVNRGEILGIIGPNGSGKTTILRLLTGILHPESGKIIVADKELSFWNRKELATQVAVVPQDTFVPFNYTVREIILMGRTPHLRLLQFEGKQDFEIMDQSMAFTDTLDLSDRYFDALSGGERQRALIARALVQEPTILLLDEPTAHLDLNHQIEILDLVKRLNAEKQLTVIFVTHDLNLAAGYCDRLILLSQGKLFCSGSPKEVITEHNIMQVYGTKVIVSYHPITGVPQVNLVSQTPFQRFTPKKTKIHIIGGGGASASLMRRLAIEGYPVTAGVLNIGDTDEVTANSLPLFVIRENPFSPISHKAIQECRKTIEQTDCVILERIMVGNGNLANLELAIYALELKKPVLVLKQSNPFDFTTGIKATEIYQQIIQQGAIQVEDHEAILEYLVNKKTAESVCKQDYS
ncbi:MAG: heme ABC transporter ATP-binding protein [bacterium]|nr:heme ABC transporter ATP-binding protein [bacterium]